MYQEGNMIANSMITGLEFLSESDEIDFDIKLELELSFEAAEEHLSNNRKVLKAGFFLKNKHNFF